MKNKKTFYVTTPIYYPSAEPHIGTAYTTIAGDILSRWNTLLDKEVFFLAGTDEHGKKMEESAERARQSPKTFADHLTLKFKETWKLLNIDYTRFIRTTDKDHEQVVQTILSEIHKKGDIYEGYYEGFYCTACEAYYTEKDLKEGCCPIHEVKIEKLKEESYFFKLSKYQKKLLKFYKDNPDFISPESRKKEIINRVKEGLQNLSISRSSFSWGIPLPFDKKHVSWVWFDALPNYLTGIGYLENSKQFKKFWPADIQILGKDILWFHAVIWPAILFSLGLKTPKKLFAHGWLTIKGAKIGKSAGNAVGINNLVEKTSVDSLRYVLFRETPFGQDGEFSESVFIDRHNNELADKLGNLVSRVSTLAEMYGLQKTTPIKSDKTVKAVNNYLENLEFDKSLNEIFSFIDQLNEYIQNKKPWETKDKKVLYQLSNGIKDVAILLSPFIPRTAEKISKTFNFEISLKSLKTPLKVSKIKKSEILFRKIDKSPSPIDDMPKQKAQKSEVKTKHQETKQITTIAPEKPTKENSPKVSYDDFSKLDLKIGKILSVKNHPNADKLYVLEVDLGNNDKRTIVAGLRNHYQPEQLQGKKAVFITNLAPATLRGVESNGMLLAAVNDDDSHVTILTPDEDISEGSKIR